MNVLRASNSFRILLIVLLLWAQSVVAQHNVDHSWHDPSEVCEVLASADHSKALVSLSQNFDFDLAYFDDYSELSESINKCVVARRSARGPPK